MIEALTQGPISAVYVVGWLALSAAIAIFIRVLAQGAFMIFGLPRGVQISFVATFFGIAFFLPIMIMVGGVLVQAVAG